MNQLKEELKDNKICLSYLGNFDDDLTDKLIGISEYYIENKTELNKIKNKVSFLIAECFQNIVRHGKIKSESATLPEIHNGLFQLNVLEDRAVLTSCNLISSKIVPSIEQKLIQVNSLDADGLKKLYNEVLENGSLSEKGGAGLGLIEMARKSGLPLKYLFKKVDDEFSNFFLCLEISNKKENVTEKVNITDIENFYTHLLGNKTILLYKGEISKDIIVPLVQMVQANFSSKDGISSSEKKSLITLIEALQNVSKHAKKINSLREGIFSLSQINNSYLIEVGNTIEAKDKIILDEMLLSIKKMSSDEINNLYKKRLLEPEITEDGNCGLGLLEIARNSLGNFNYSFSYDSNNEILYSIKIKI